MISGTDKSFRGTGVFVFKYRIQQKGGQVVAVGGLSAALGVFVSNCPRKGQHRLSVWTKNETRRMRQTESDSLTLQQRSFCRRAVKDCSWFSAPSLPLSQTSGERNMNDAGGNCEEGGREGGWRKPEKGIVTHVGMPARVDGRRRRSSHIERTRRSNDNGLICSKSGGREERRGEESR